MAYKIAFLTYEWSTEVAAYFSRGIQYFVHEHEDVIVHVYHGFGGRRLIDAPRGHLQIFDLAYISSYDGIVIHGNRVWNPEMRQEVVNRAEKYGKPVVSINYPLEHCLVVGQDNYSVGYKTAEHLLKDHQCKTLAIIAGLKSSAEATTRLQAALDCANNYGIEDVKVYGYEWNQECGEKSVREMIEANALPEAIVCGNDDLAFGAEKELLRQGIRIPDQVKIVGVDNLCYAEAAPVRISTVDRDDTGTAYKALEVIVNKVKGKEVEQKTFVPVKMICSNSCGCTNGTTEYATVKEKYMNLVAFQDDFYRLNNMLAKRLDEAHTLKDIAEIVEEEVQSAKLGYLYLVLNGLYLDNFNNNNSIRHYSDEMALIRLNKEIKEKGYPLFQRFDRKDLLPEEELKGKRLLDVYSLQSEDTHIGYIVFTQSSSSVEFGIMQTVFTLIDHAIERVRKAQVMESLNQRLSVLYITDPLTGLYNRFGLEQRGREFYDEILHRNHKAYLNFIDIDEMKRINDQYGHECGDDAIVTIASMIQATQDQMNVHAFFSMRYGGDEFLTISDESICEILQQELERAIVDKRRTYELNATIGEVFVLHEDNLSLQEAIDKADDAMYQVKKLRKQK